MRIAFYLMTTLALLLTGCSTTPRAETSSQFSQEQQASMIIRYYSDATSYLLKPDRREGAFRTPFSRDQILQVARGLEVRELAVVVIGVYPSRAEERVVIDRWSQYLKDAGFRKTVFVRDSNYLRTRA